MKRSVKDVTKKKARRSTEWQQETPFQEELELVRHCSDLSFGGFLMRRAYYRVKPGDKENYLEVFLKDDTLSIWASVRVRECYNEVEIEDEGRVSVAQDILRKSADFLRRINAPSDGVGGVTLSCVCPHCHCFPLEDCIWWVSSEHGDGNKKTKKQCNWWRAACGGQHNWEAPNAVLATQDSTDRREAKVFRARAAAQGMCDTLFIAVGMYAAVKIGCLEKERRSKKVVKPKFTTDFPGADIRDVADELTLRAHDSGFCASLSTPRM